MKLSLLALPTMIVGLYPLPCGADDRSYPETVGRCLIVAEGKSYTLQPCAYRFHYERVTGHMLTFEQKRPRKNYVRFGYIYFEGKTRTVGEGSWNGPDIRNRHSDHFVGKLKRKGHCWANAKARFCFWPAPSAGRERR